jgi:hypothetical protein
MGKTRSENEESRKKQQSLSPLQQSLTQQSLSISETFFTDKSKNQSNLQFTKLIKKPDSFHNEPGSQ